MTLKYFKLDPEAVDPNFQTQMAACFDLTACFSKNTLIKIYKGKDDVATYPILDGDKGEYFVTLMPGERALIPTGLIFDLPEGMSLRLHPRSGMALKYGLMLANCEGIVDEDYVYETKFIILNTNQNDAIRIYSRERIAQAELVRYEQCQFEEIYTEPGQKSDRVGGFGSTG